MPADSNETTPYLFMPESDPLAFDRAASPAVARRRRYPRWLLQVGLGLAGCLLVLGLGLPIIAWFIHREAGAVRPAATRAASTAALKDPWPECAIIRQWLREHTGSPEALEVSSWENRGRDSVGRLYIAVRYRGKTRAGGFASKESFFYFEDGRLLFTDALKNPGGDLFDPEPSR